MPFRAPLHRWPRSSRGPASRPAHLRPLAKHPPRRGSPQGAETPAAGLPACGRPPETCCQRTPIGVALAIVTTSQNLLPRGNQRLLCGCTSRILSMAWASTGLHRSVGTLQRLLCAGRRAACLAQLFLHLSCSHLSDTTWSQPGSLLRPPQTSPGTTPRVGTLTKQSQTCTLVLASPGTPRASSALVAGDRPGLGGLADGAHLRASSVPHCWCQPQGEFLCQGIFWGGRPDEKNPDQTQRSSPPSPRAWQLVELLQNAIRCPVYSGWKSPAQGLFPQAEYFTCASTSEGEASGAEAKPCSLILAEESS